MKDGIHPEYKTATVVCGCGNTFQTRSTTDRIAVEICSNCHPFYTGKQKFVDTAGMVEKFSRKWGTVDAKKEEEKAKEAKSERKKQLAVAATLKSLPPQPPKAEAPPQRGFGGPPSGGRGPAPKPAPAKPAAAAPAAAPAAEKKAPPAPTAQA